ncbi:hypothetical protein KsCSTR_14460 [Candidatus Kuenenia stuttgartiensis]|uniref:Uncharacterized protein n=1 Tax=Kuenenia stuttgartiensis TaxID=174633 RepID=Q1Q1C2_KUEST|nr:hypothetical protein KsCSTR_14460 [Candidatus Kuenenia stuttgartiensis]CAJ73797.1 unknown protein [Candidatus Kuenenia stuttgartiensis]
MFHCERHVTQRSLNNYSIHNPMLQHGLCIAGTAYRKLGSYEVRFGIYDFRFGILNRTSYFILHTSQIPAGLKV